MAWYEAHQTMAKHPKTLRLSRLLKVDRRYAVGLLHDLFSWGLDAAGKYGELTGMEKEDIAAALDLSGKKGLQTVDALVASGYLELDGCCYSIHDWYEYAGKLMEKREADRKRKAEEAARKKAAEAAARDQMKIPEELLRNSNGIPAERQRNSARDRTVPNQNSTTLSFPLERKEKKEPPTAVETAPPSAPSFRRRQDYPDEESYLQALLYD